MYSSKENEGWLKKAGVLADALPYMKKFSGKTVVIKLFSSDIQEVKSYEEY